jgi:hypothetical protein
MTQRPSEHLRTLQDVNARKTKIQDITDALISSGYTSLDQQAKALGLNRATVWTIRENKHKLGRLSAKTIGRIITNPTTPPRVLAALQEYVVEKWVAPEQPKRRDRQSAL